MEIRRLSKLGIYNSYQLLGKYLELIREGDSINEHSIKYINYLSTLGIGLSNRSLISEGISKKVSKMCPGFIEFMNNQY